MSPAERSQRPCLRVPGAAELLLFQRFCLFTELTHGYTGVLMRKAKSPTRGWSIPGKHPFLYACSFTVRPPAEPSILRPRRELSPAPHSPRGPATHGSSPEPTPVSPSKLSVGSEACASTAFRTVLAAGFCRSARSALHMLLYQRQT